jgi:hypothetical protein
MINEVVHNIWLNLIDEVNLDPDRFSSEKSIIFHFAWILNQNFQHRIKYIDFEKQMYQNFADGQYLDLFFEIDGISIGIEFKYPKSTKNNKDRIGNSGNSNQTQTRIKIINDIKRLSHLVNVDKIDYGVFLMLTNEIPYVFMGNRKKTSTDFQTYHNTNYLKGKNFPVDLIKSRDQVICPTDITFSWNGIHDNLVHKKVAWINPIVIYKS